MTTMTSAIASSSVLTTSRIDSRTAIVGLKAISYFIDGGKLTASRLRVARMAASSWRALALGCWNTPNPTASRPSKRRFRE